MIIKAQCSFPVSKEVCFEAFSDLNNLADKVAAITKIEVLTSGEIGVGTKFKETRVMFGKESSETMEITLFEPHSHFREEAFSNGMHYTTDWKFTDSNEETVVSIAFHIKPQTLIARMISPMFRLMSGSLKKAFVADLADMKKAISGT